MVAVKADEEAVERVDCPVTLKVPLEVKEEVAVRDPNVAELPDKVEMLPVMTLSNVEVELVAMISEKVLTPAKLWEVVETSPLAVKEAFGRLKEWIVDVEEIVKSVPEVVTANVCPEAVRPFSDVSPPPAPASAPQEKSPVVLL